MRVSRRNVLLGASAAALASPRAARAQAAEKSSVVVIFLAGGNNAFFGAADAYVPGGYYSCTADNVRDLGNGVVVDKGTVGTLADPVLQKLGVVGVSNMNTDHGGGQTQFFLDGTVSNPLRLADAINGTFPLRCAYFGGAPNGTHPPYNGVAMTGVPDLTVAVQLINPSADPNGPSRELMARTFRRAIDASSRRFARSPNTLSHTWDGLHALAALLEQPAPGVSWPDIAAAYGIPPTDMTMLDFRAHLAGAELMVRGGTDVVCIRSDGWDDHGDSLGLGSRTKMSMEIMPALSTFLSRTLAMPGHNVVTVVATEFSRVGGRTGFESGHAPGATDWLFGKYVKPGTTGRPDVTAMSTQLPCNYALPALTPSVRGFWSLLAAAARVPDASNPFGPNAHPSLVVAS
jgi:hypothetical protein